MFGTAVKNQFYLNFTEFEEIEIKDEAQLNIYKYLTENFVTNGYKYQVKLGLPYTNR